MAWESRVVFTSRADFLLMSDCRPNYLKALRENEFPCIHNNLLLNFYYAYLCIFVRPVITAPPVRGAGCFDECVCLFSCLSVCLSVLGYLRKYMSSRHKTGNYLRSETMQTTEIVTMERHLQVVQ